MPILLWSQEGLDDQNYDQPIVPGLRIGIVPSSFLNTWTGLQGNISYTYKDCEYVANFGYLFGRNNKLSFLGFRFRPTLKYYFSQTEKRALYLGIGGLIRNINIDNNAIFGRFNDSYFEELSYTENQRTNGIFGMFGILLPLRGERFWLNIGVGLGGAQLTISHTDFPDDAALLVSTPIFNSEINRERTSAYFIGIFHCAFQYHIW